jgi:hypothetical protein
MKSVSSIAEVQTIPASHLVAPDTASAKPQNQIDQPQSLNVAGMDGDASISMAPATE